MRLLLTGAGGQFGLHFQRVVPADVEVLPCTRSGPLAWDLAEPDGAADVVTRAEPDWIVHAGAMTDVDGCERDPELAHRVNGESTGALARAAADAGARMLYVSTDYVFDGERGDYTEEDEPAPRSAYGRSKLAGEVAARAVLDRLVVARTSVVFGPDRPNFVSWLAGALLRGEPVRIVEDQRVSPTYTGDLAAQVLALINADARGTYHTAGADAVTRLEMAHEVARVFGADGRLITPIRSSDLGWLAPRPRDSSLGVGKIGRIAHPMTLRDALESFARAWRRASS